MTFQQHHGEVLALAAAESRPRNHQSPVKHMAAPTPASTVHAPAPALWLDPMSMAMVPAPAGMLWFCHLCNIVLPSADNLLSHIQSSHSDIVLPVASSVQ